jgi:hypothetical protein
MFHQHWMTPNFPISLKFRHTSFIYFLWASLLFRVCVFISDYFKDVGDDGKRKCEPWDFCVEENKKNWKYNHVAWFSVGLFANNMKHHWVNIQGETIHLWAVVCWFVVSRRIGIVFGTDYFGFSDEFGLFSKK